MAFLSGFFGERTKTWTVGSRIVEHTEQLSEGGFGFIYQVKDRGSGKSLALKLQKCQDAASEERAVGEAELLKQFSGVLSVLQYVEHQVVPVVRGSDVLILTELCDGTVLDLLPADTWPGTPFGAAAPAVQQAKVLAILVSIGGALQCVHSKGFIHFDVKPQNILTSGGRVCLCDFGSASKESFPDLENADRATLLRVQDAIDGRASPMFRAPELCDVYKRLPVSGKCDMFALGCTMYALMFGVHPFPADGLLANMSGTYQVPQSATAYDKPLLVILQRLLKPTPQERPTGAELRAACEKVEAAASALITAVVVRISWQCAMGTVGRLMVENRVRMGIMLTRESDVTNLGRDLREMDACDGEKSIQEITASISTGLTQPAMLRWGQAVGAGLDGLAAVEVTSAEPVMPLEEFVQPAQDDWAQFDDVPKAPDLDFAAFQEAPPPVSGEGAEGVASATSLGTQAVVAVVAGDNVLVNAAPPVDFTNSIAVAGQEVAKVAFSMHLCRDLDSDVV
mmetsp:Transcript_52694/g.120231  ORF Transcript_52694/g.120231 Transcript_52694/m.120231 type:complete len:511 (-) Transcript_52694:9-1541(-)